MFHLRLVQLRLQPLPISTFLSEIPLEIPEFDRLDVVARFDIVLDKVRDGSKMGFVQFQNVRHILKNEPLPVQLS